VEEQRVDSGGMTRDPALLSATGEDRKTILRHSPARGRRFQGPALGFQDRESREETDAEAEDVSALSKILGRAQTPISGRCTDGVAPLVP
jgi:hypothetical protein